MGKKLTQLFLLRFGCPLPPSVSGSMVTYLLTEHAVPIPSIAVCCISSAVTVFEKFLKSAILMGFSANLSGKHSYIICLLLSLPARRGFLFLFQNLKLQNEMQRTVMLCMLEYSRSIIPTARFKFPFIVYEYVHIFCRLTTGLAATLQ